MEIVLDGVVGATVELPHVDGTVPKVEGLMLLEADHRGVRVLAVTDADDAASASLALELRVIL